MIFAIAFRMIFVVQVFDNIAGHSLPFIGLQWCLCLVAFENFCYAAITHNLPFWNHTNRLLSLIISVVYVIGLLGATGMKNVLEFNVLLFNNTLNFNISSESYNNFGTSLDIVWMILAACVPVFLALRGRIVTTDVEISLPIDNVLMKRKMHIDSRESSDDESVEDKSNDVENNGTKKRLKTVIKDRPGRIVEETEEESE